MSYFNHFTKKNNTAGRIKNEALKNDPKKRIVGGSASNVNNKNKYSNPTDD